MTIKKPEIKKVSGVYIIHCLKNNRKYIGSSNDVFNRIKTHKRDLNRGSHNNLMLQNDYKKYGSVNFVFRILDNNIPENMLLAYEKVYMFIHDSIVRFKGYNQINSTVNHKLFKQAYFDLLEKGIVKNNNI